jgi:NTE family protein
MTIMPERDIQFERCAPVQTVETGSAHDDPKTPQPGIVLCLSGGGYRAMLFHLGALWRLNELQYLPKLARVSSVSGGSITAGLLGLKWPRLGFASDVAANFDAELVQPIRALAGKTIDQGAILGGIFTPGTIAEKVADVYRAQLFGTATLQDLPPDPPRFVINATSVQSGALFRFSRPFAADYRVGQMLNPTIELAVAVAASSAFPPVLSPVTLDLDPAAWAPPSGLESEDLHREPFLSEVVLTDGGVYDNLGLETAWKKYRTVLVSDGGGKLDAEEEPHSDWVRHAVRITNIIDNQVRSLRKRQVIGSFAAGVRSGTYWGIRSDITAYSAASPLDAPVEKTLALADIATRLKRLDDGAQERLINWGYAICDVAMRTHVDAALPAPSSFPYPSSGVG